MGIPLNNIIRNCKGLEDSESLKKFEQDNGNTFRKQVKNTRMVSNLMVYQLMDMSDWNALKNNKFKTVSAKFNLPECLVEIYDIMNMKAQIKNIKLELSPWKHYLPSDVLGDR
jgi:hypothetical protein